MELRHGFPRVQAYDEATQDEQRVDDINFLEEIYCQAAVRSARYQQGLRRYHSCHIRSRELEVGDLVLRRIQVTTVRNKLSPKWEGPYRVVQFSRPGVVRVETEEGVMVNNSWNIQHLRKFYP